MDWWYKSDKHTVTEHNAMMLQDAVKSMLRDGKSLATVCLYNDSSYFYIKTSNKILLNHFLFQNGFEEMDEEWSDQGLRLLYS